MQSPFANLSPVVKNLLIINIICFLPFLLLNEGMVNTIYNLASAHYFDSPLFRPWQPITYMFFHGGWLHIIFNMFALYTIGSVLEYHIGSQKFVLFYFICGLGGIGLQLLVQAIEVYHYVGHFTIPYDYQTTSIETLQKLKGIYGSSMVGASGAIFGIFIAFGMIYPNAELMIMFIPIPIKAKYVMPAYVVFELSVGIGQFQGDDVAHFAHLGGALIGFILVKLWRLQGGGGYRY